MNVIAKMFSVSPSTILRWIRKFGEQHLQLPELKIDTTVVVELDERWHYLKKSVQMVNITVALFARFRVNGNVFDIFNFTRLATNNII